MESTDSVTGFYFMSVQESTLDVGAAPPPAMPDTPVVDSSTTLGTSGASSEAQPTGDVIATGEQSQQPQETDIFAGIPTLDELQQEVERRTPYAEGLHRLRAELERVKPDADLATKWKPLGEVGEPDDLRAAYEQRQKLFSPVVNPNTNQVEYDERGLQKRTSHPWLEEMEKETPGFIPRHLDDLMRYEYTDANGQKSNMAQVYFRDLGLDVARYDDYLNIDKLLAQTNGAVSPTELNAIAEPDREAYKSLPASLRRDWGSIEADEQRWHLDTANERIQVRQTLERQDTERKQAETAQHAQFQARLQQDVLTDLTTVRTQGLTSLRDSLTKAVQLSADANVNGAYIDAIIAPLALLLSPDFSELGAHMLESMGTKLDASFNDALNAFVTARQQHVIAKAHGEQGAAAAALKEADGKFARIMAKFNDLALKRAQTFGYQAKQIATANGNALAAASAVRAMPGNGSAVETATGILPTGMDPYSPQANAHLWSQTQRPRGQ